MEEAMAKLSLTQDNDDDSHETGDFEVLLAEEPMPEVGVIPQMSKSNISVLEEEEAEPVRIVKPETLKQEMATAIRDAAELTCLRPTSVRILLNIFQWDKIKVLEQTGYGESFYQLRDIGIIISPIKPVNYPFTPTCSMTQFGGGACLNCKRVVNVSCMVFTSCEHWFCIRCFQRHLMLEINIGDRSHFKCPYISCLMYLEDDIVLKTLPPHLMESYLQLCLNDFVKCSKFRAICPTIGCNRTCYLDVNLSPKCRKVQCDCGTSYCFGCSNLWHFPLSCSQLEKWLKIFKKIPEYSTVANFNMDKRPCPHCSVILKKNWKSSIAVACETCNYKFCWTCQGDLFRCKNHVCTKVSAYTKPELKALVKVYRDYDELKNEFSILENEVTQQDSDITDVKTSMEKVCETIRKSQQLLRHSMVFSFFLDKTLQKLRFLNQVFQFEIALEKLLDDFDKEIDVTIMEVKVISEREQLLQVLDEGFEHDLWKFRM